MQDSSRKVQYGKTAREYKDRLFKFIFGNPENKSWTLSLYNAMNGTHYDDPDDITITTIKDVLYMSMKNDVSFLIRFIMNLYEQNSTYNPNTPMRLFIYGGMIYSAYVESDPDYNIYSPRLQRLLFRNAFASITEQTTWKIEKFSSSEMLFQKARILISK